ncbi:hypothetical protein KIH74_34995 [Kineosporia sp. J2-2]|uniref:Uncharacterized protein n=1 Tax=Kineosporia corallincola TaxID=2835133 RepID=A0ABS5TTT7_9ACTN|nr:hypothetical protein [Kineosporia corallincola]MBT0774205.1 hypothetical protein [Kineosporia corallincola]
MDYAFWIPEDSAEPDLVDPFLLALEAESRLKLPKVSLARSPGGDTWVNEYTWVWLESGWKELSATARSGGVWATVTASPVRMKVSASGAAQGVTCSGPGRAWSAADGGGAPADGGCALRFTRSGEGIGVSVAVPYRVSWTGSGGAGGDLGTMTATGEESVTVLEAVAVSRS